MDGGRTRLLGDTQGAGDGERWAEELQFAHWRRLSLSEKAGIVSDLCRAAHRVSIAGLKLRHPAAGEEELELRAACMRLGRETVENVIGRPLPFDE
jgi:hypothetical protein